MLRQVRGGDRRPGSSKPRTSRHYPAAAPYVAPAPYGHELGASGSGVERYSACLVLGQSGCTTHPLVSGHRENSKNMKNETSFFEYVSEDIRYMRWEVYIVMCYIILYQVVFSDHVKLDHIIQYYVTMYLVAPLKIILVLRYTNVVLNDYMPKQYVVCYCTIQCYNTLYVGIVYYIIRSFIFSLYVLFLDVKRRQVVIWQIMVVL